jgi:hypothetical protein
MPEFVPLDSGKHPVSSSAELVALAARRATPNRGTDSVDKRCGAAILRATNGRLCLLAPDAQVAELVDALASGASGH